MNDPTYKAVQVVAGLCLLAVLYLQMLGASPLPWSDEWELVPYAVGAKPVSLDWLWSQHSDHRIPLQKLGQTLLLRATGVDFRLLVVANALLAFLATLALIRAVCSYRGHSHFGDALFPVVLLNPGFSVFHWGFQFQFLSSVLLTLIVIALLIQQAPRPSRRTVIAATACCALLALCGMNGVILAATLSIALLIWIYVARSTEGPLASAAMAAFATVPLIIGATVILNWAPTSAAGVGATADAAAVAKGILKNFLLLTSPHAASLPPSGPVLYYALNVVVYVSALVVLGVQLLRPRTTADGLDIAKMMLAAGFVGAFAVLGSVAVGRAAYWSKGLEMHYAYLGTLLPLIAWIVLSVQTSEKVRVLAAVPLLVMYASMFQANIQARSWHADSARKDQLAMCADFDRGARIAEFVDGHNAKLFYIDDVNSRRFVRENLVLLKRSGVFPYTQLAD